MIRRIKSRGYNILLTVVAFAIAAICFSGVVLEEDMTGRMIYGVTWTLVGVFWLGSYIRTGNSS